MKRLLLLVLVPRRRGPRAGARRVAAAGRPDLAEPGEVLGLDLRRRTVLAPDGVVDLLAVDADLLRGVDPQTHLVAADVDHGDLDVVADHDRLVSLTGQHQHVWLLPGMGTAAAASRPRVVPKGACDYRTGPLVRPSVHRR